MRGLAIACLLMVTAPIAAPAGAQDRPRLPDGRAVIDIQGVRLAFPAQGPELTRTEFNITIRNKMSLKQVLESPDIARRISSKACNGSP